LAHEVGLNLTGLMYALVWFRPYQAELVPHGIAENGASHVTARNSEFAPVDFTPPA